MIVLAPLLAGCFLLGAVIARPDPRGAVDVSIPVEWQRSVRLPGPDLSPREVASIQVAGLRDWQEDSEGLVQCYVLASPANRRVTGPIDRFKGMVASPAYSPLVRHRLAQVGDAVVDGDRAGVLVALLANDGRVAAYRFLLSRQTTPGLEGCWMTDAVLPVLSFGPGRQ